MFRMLLICDNKVNGYVLKKGTEKKLFKTCVEIGEKEDKMQQMFKQVELKNMEVQRYKTAAEVAKVKSFYLLRVNFVIRI